MTPMRIALALVLLLLQFGWSDALARAPTPAEQLLPRAIGPVSLDERKVLQSEAAGIVLLYSSPRRVWLTVYVYDAGLSSVPEQLASPAVSTAFDHAVREIKSLVESGRAKSIKLDDLPPNLVKPEGCGREYLLKQLEIEFSHGRNSSYIFLTTVRGSFVKVRLSHEAENTGAPAVVSSFFAELSRVLGSC
jgi:hypothetical protein